MALWELGLGIIDSSSSSDDDDEELLMGERAFLTKRTRIQNYIEIIGNYTNEGFKEHFRVTRNTYNAILEKVGTAINDCVVAPGQPRISAEKQLFVALWTLATPDSYRSIGDRFDLPKSTTHACVQRVVNALCTIAHECIRWPTGQSAVEVIEGFRRMKGMVGIIGAVDGCHIAIPVPQEHGGSYINRKGFASLILQGTCNDKLKFIHCYIGQPGSVHDARVYRNSELSHYMAQNDFFPNGSFLLGDSAYPCLPNLLVPFKDNGHLTRAQRNYNYIHSSSRMVIERSFGLLKGRFRRLFYLHMHDIEWANKFILAACVLHNICQDMGEVLEIESRHNEGPNAPDVDIHHNNPTGRDKRNEVMNTLRMLI